MAGPTHEDLIDSPLLRTVADRPTDYWNDSCALDELRYAVARGATGATSNPSIVLEVLRKERRLLDAADRRACAAPIRRWTETDLTWAVVEEMAVRGAAVLEPVFVREGGRKGRLSLQTNPANYPNAERMLEQGRRFATLAPNMQVKFPATRAGIAAIEPATAEGISINATVSLHGPAGRGGRRGRRARARRVRRRAAAIPRPSRPVCTIMIGRLDDWLRVLAERDDVAVDPDALDWAGIAAFKRAYAHLRGARLPDAAPRRGVSTSAPLDRARRRRRRPDDAARVAGPLQRERHQPRRPDRRPRRTRRSSSSCWIGSPTSGAPTSPTGWPSTSSIGYGADGPDAARVHRLVPRPHRRGPRRRPPRPGSSATA